MNDKARALIVDDNEICRTRDMKLLGKIFDCETATNGFEAFKMVCNALNVNKPFDLVLLDIKMPLMDGLMALEAIREAEKLKNINYGDGAKIIMTTALNESKAIMSSFSKGCEGYLVKPYSVQQLNDKITELFAVSIRSN